MPTVKQRCKILKRLSELFVKWQNKRELKKARKAAKKYNYDLIIECVFDYQLKPYGYPNHGDIIKLEMQSGKTAFYKTLITKHWDGGTGQKNWLFEFQGYDA